MLDEIRQQPAALERTLRGEIRKAEALRRMFQGGKPVLSQWVQDGRDLNVTCPGTSAEMTRWFHQY